jgi:hypothetical protein
LTRCKRIFAKNKVKSNKNQEKAAVIFNIFFGWGSGIIVFGKVCTITSMLVFGNEEA